MLWGFYPTVYREVETDYPERKSCSRGDAFKTQIAQMMNMQLCLMDTLENGFFITLNSFSKKPFKYNISCANLLIDEDSHGRVTK